MREEELKVLYGKISAERNGMLPRYIRILQKHFPNALRDPKDVFIEDYIYKYGMDKEFAEEMYMYEEKPLEDWRDPITGFWVKRKFYDYLYNDKKGMASQDREFIKSFIHILTAYGTLYYAFKNNDDSYIDSRVIQFENEDVVITDPCYLIPSDSTTDMWSKCGCGYDLNNLGIERFLTRNTLYGDWSCTVYDLDDKDNKVLGKFCADVGLVSVIGLEDIKNNINDKFENWALEHDWCVTILRNFTGIVQIKTGFDANTYTIYCYVRGSGSTNFVGKQTGF